MPLKLIVNADDFGRHELINRAVEEAVTKGCLRSATLMPGGKAFEDAVKIGKRQPSLGVGIHFTLANGFPILPPGEIPSLVTEQGVFYGNYLAFLKRFAKGQVNLEEVRSELSAQLEKMKQTGLALTHVDSHQHLHHVPGILGIVLDLAQSAGIPALRISHTRLFDGDLGSVGQLIGRLGLGSLAGYAGREAKKRGFRIPDHFAGIVAGEAVSEDYLEGFIDRLQEGTTEVMLHPGTDNGILRADCQWDHDFEAELWAVTSPKILQKLKERNIEPINFRSLGTGNK